MNTKCEILNHFYFGPFLFKNGPLDPLPLPHHPHKKASLGPVHFFYNNAAAAIGEVL